ncbi:prepilin peptidase [Stenotrophomonas mori]|uniref:Prepilin peptidase n=1 Tax=Stenotrophomonas mori TaxID=2871096 RepID=A0ABT0SDW2_9GAMM|nr:prepilin peptidase [Stenotrophomonas mori]MCL7713515.1 prepilin peptidase [Stenotrophomonas mori]
MAPLSAALAAVLGAYTVYTDLYARRVSNRGLLAAVLGGVAASLLLPAISTPPGMAATGLLLGLAALLPFYVLGWMGAGDVKLFAVLGLLLGARALVPLWIIASLLAGAYALAVLFARSRHASHLLACLPAVDRARERMCGCGWFNRMMASRQGRSGIPYAAYLGIATLMVTFPEGTHG